VVFRISGKEGARQYLVASERYLRALAPSARMSYPFPSVGVCCLFCGAEGCSRWKGYYIRQVVCTNLKYAGPLAIHLAQCRVRGVDYTYWPDFLVPFLEPTLPTLRAFYEAWVSYGYGVRAAIDAVVGGIRGEYFLPVSIAYSWLSRVSQGLVLHGEDLKIRVPNSIGAHVLRGFRVADVRPLFEAERLWRSSQPIVFLPP
jgi:hypothetical protein